MNFQIINSGSDGNCVIIENYIAIDCGVSFKSLKDYYKDLKIVFLTHIHGDHFKKSTIKKLASERPLLRFGCCEWLVEDLIKCGVDKRNIDVLKIGDKYDYKEFIVEPIELYHDVPNCGYKIDINDKKMIYATDTNTLDNIEAKGYNLYLVEANYEEEELESRIRERKENGLFVYEERVKETHMSKEATNDWLIKNASDSSQFVYMHEHKKEKI